MFLEGQVEGDVENVLHYQHPAHYTPNPVHGVKGDDFEWASLDNVNLCLWKSVVYFNFESPVHEDTLYVTQT